MTCFFYFSERTHTSKLSKGKEKIFKSEIYIEIERLKDLNKLKIRFERLSAFGYNKINDITNQ